MKKTWIQLGVVFILSCVFLYLFFKRINWDEVLGYMNDADWRLFIIIICLIPLHLLTRAIRWKYLLDYEKKGVSLYNRFAGNAVGFTVSLVFPGRLGELIKPLYLAKKENMSKGFVIGTQVVERLFDMFTMCFMLGLFLLAKPIFPSYFKANEEAYSKLVFWGALGMGFAVLLLLITLALYFFREKTFKVISTVLKFLPKKIFEKVFELFQEFVEGLQFFRSLGHLLMYIFLSFVVWIGIIFYYWIFFFTYNESLPFFMVMPYCFLIMVGASIPTPGMVGGYHYFSMLGMTAILGIAEGPAGSMTIVVHAIQVILTVLIGYAILSKDGISLLQVRKLGENSES
jgi:uncharacterized protein (TIRG00374 family)